MRIQGRVGAGGTLRAEERRGPSQVRLACLALVLALSLLAGPPALAKAPSNILIIYSFGRLLPANLEGDNALREALATRPDIPVTISFEYLDNLRFTGDAYERTFAEYLRNKYASMPPEVVLVAADDVLDFVMRHRSDLFPGVPVLYMNVTRASLDALAPLPPDVIGTQVSYDCVPTLRQALRWHRGTGKVVFVTGASAWDRHWEQLIRSQVADLPAGLEFEFLAGLPTEELQHRLRQLQAGTLVYTPGFFLDGHGRETSPKDSTKLVTEAAPVPVYGAYSTQVGMGVVGGDMASFAAVGRLGAETAIKLLQGMPPSEVRPPVAMPTQMMVDWRELRRWGIASRDLPAATEVLFRKPSLWESNRDMVILGIVVILLQSGLIGALLFERRRRRRTVAELARSEKRMRLATGAASLSAWIFDADGRAKPDRNVADRHLSGAEAGGPLVDFRETLERIVPQDRPAVDEALSQALANQGEFDVEYRVGSLDGEYRWQSARGGVDPSRASRLVGVAIDITPRKQAEAQMNLDRAALYHMSRVSLLGQLSASIAHQLNQPLASILANAETAQRMLEREPVDLAELRLICDDIVADDHRADQVIRRLTALFRRGAAKFEPLDLNELVRDSLDLIRGALTTRSATLITNLAPEPLLVSGDRVQLQQLLLNLIVNAADAMAPLSDRSHDVTITTRVRGENAELCITDRGPGVPAEMRDKLFEPFWTTREGGMGMGLTICRSIAVAHNGTLAVSDAPSGGARFCASFPQLGAQE